MHLEIWEVARAAKRRAANPVTRWQKVIYLSQDSRNYTILWWDDLEMSCNETTDAT